MGFTFKRQFIIRSEHLIGQMDLAAAPDRQRWKSASIETSIITLTRPMWGVNGTGRGLDFRKSKSVMQPCDLKSAMYCVSKHVHELVLASKSILRNLDEFYEIITSFIHSSCSPTMICSPSACVHKTFCPHRPKRLCLRGTAMWSSRLGSMPLSERRSVAEESI